MARSLIQLYALTVCFFTLMCLVVTVGLGIYDLVRIAWPDFTVQENIMLQSNEQYLMYHPEKKDLPEGDIVALREKSQREGIEAERRTATQSLVFAGIILAIDMVVYAIHWRIARKAEVRSV